MCLSSICTQIAGLWVMLAAAVGLGMLLVIGHLIYLRYTRHVLKPLVEKSAHSWKQRLGNSSTSSNKSKLDANHGSQQGQRGQASC
jgi:hypothetical protein